MTTPLERVGWRKDDLGHDLDFSAVHGVRVRIAGRDLSVDWFDEHGGWTITAVTAAGLGVHILDDLPQPPEPSDRPHLHVVKTRAHRDNAR